jgi:hypothetical protein
MTIISFYTCRDIFQSAIFIQLSRTNKRMREKMVLCELDKRILGGVEAIITNYENNSMHEFRLVSMDTLEKWHILKFSSKHKFAVSNGMIIDSKMSVQIQTPFRRFDCKERNVFSNDVTDLDEFDISFADSDYASVKLHCIIDKDRTIYIDEIILEYKCDMERQLTKNKIICTLYGC